MHLNKSDCGSSNSRNSYGDIFAEYQQLPHNTNIAVQSTYHTA